MERLREACERLIISWPANTSQGDVARALLSMLDGQTAERDAVLEEAAHFAAHAIKRVENSGYENGLADEEMSCEEIAAGIRALKGKGNSPSAAAGGWRPTREVLVEWADAILAITSPPGDTP